MRGIALPAMGMLGALLLCDMAVAPQAEAKSAAWLKRDREVIRQMNRRELARVRRRDAEQAARNRESRAAYEREMEAYHAQRRRYNERLANWREAAARCRSGDYSACD